MLFTSKEERDDWWSITAIHEAAHGIAAFCLDCHPIELRLNRRVKAGDGAAGVCLAPYEQSCYGLFANIFVKNAPFAASQHEVLPCGDKGDLHERQQAYADFVKLTGHKDQEVFRKFVDTPTINFFASGQIQAAVLVLANKLYEKNTVSLKKINYWREQLNIPSAVVEHFQYVVTALAKAIVET